MTTGTPASLINLLGFIGVLRSSEEFVTIGEELDLIEAYLDIERTQTGVGVTEEALVHRRNRGLGLSNVEQRLQRYGNGVSPLFIRSTPGSGTTVEIQVPLQAREPVNLMESVKSS
jgi:sensor histidine kinase YesM